MSFCLLADESVEDGIKRIVSDEIKQAIMEIDSPRLKRSEAIHEVRKHCKKIRGALRLVRPQFEETYQFENVWFRDTAKGLAELRDAEAIIETCNGLLDKFSDQIDRRAFAPMRRALTLRRNKIFEETGDLNEKLKKIRAIGKLGGVRPSFRPKNSAKSPPSSLRPHDFAVRSACLGQALILVAGVFGYFLAEPIRRLKFFAFLP
jgi:hypothetical protein